MTRRTRWIAVALALAGAFVITLAVWAAAWWTAGEVDIGPYGGHHCFGDDCRGLQWVGGSALWERSAVATWAGGIVTSGALILLAGALAAGRTPPLVARMTLVALTTTAVVGGYFIAKFPGVGGISHVGPGIGMFAGAIVCGAIAAILGRR